MQTMKKYEATVCFLLRGQIGKEEVLLAIKESKIGIGCWNGYGGKPEPEDQNLEETCVRELLEESSVQTRVEDVQKVAIIEFTNQTASGEAFQMNVHFYICRKWEGEAKATKEMSNPTWFPVESLPTNEMQSADVHFVPQILSGKKISGKFHYGANRETIFREVSEVDEL